MEMLRVEADVFPEGARAPAVEIVHLHQDADLSVLRDHLLDQRLEPLVILPVQLPRHPDFENISARLLTHVNWHRPTLLGPSIPRTREVRTTNVECRTS